MMMRRLQSRVLVIIRMLHDSFGQLSCTHLHLNSVASRERKASDVFAGPTVRRQTERWAHRLRLVTDVEWFLQD